MQDDQNLMSPEDDCNLKSLKNSQVLVFPNCTNELNNARTCMHKSHRN